jgi:hypothetical protein
MKKDGIQTRKRKPKSVGKNKATTGKTESGTHSFCICYGILITGYIK